MVNFKSLSCLSSPVIPIYAFLHIQILSPDTKKNLLLPFHACAISSIADYVCHALPFIFRKKKVEKYPSVDPTKINGRGPCEPFTD